MSILKVGVLAVAGVLLAVQFKNGKTEYSTYISVVLGILIFGFMHLISWKRIWI